MSRILRGIAYAAATMAMGGVGYLLGKYRHRTKGVISLTMLGLAAILYAPRGCDVMEKYIDRKADVEEVRIRSQAAADSIENKLLMDASRKGTAYLGDGLKNVSENVSNIMHTYKEALSDMGKSYDALLEENYSSTNKVLDAASEQTDALRQRLENIRDKHDCSGDIQRKTDLKSANSSSNAKISGKPRLEDRIDANDALASSIQLTQANPVKDNHGNGLESYWLDVDKSERIVTLYGLRSDGTKISLNIKSYASFPRDGGPIDGTYVLKNKGRRSGSLYPGFLEMASPVGISGEGEGGKYSNDISRGALANNTGIRVPNKMFYRIEDLVDEKTVLVYVHD